MNTTLRRRDPRSGTVVAALVEQGLLDPRRTDEADSAVRSALDVHRAPAASVKRRLAEVAGYVGGALVVAASIIFLTEEWDELAFGGRLIALSTITATLLAAGTAVAGTTPGGLRAVRDAGQATRRRLAGTLAVGGALSGAFAVGVLADQPAGSAEWPWLAASVTMLVVTLVGYVGAPTAFGQVAAAAAAVTAVAAIVGVAVGDAAGMPLGPLVLALAIGWLLLTECGTWREEGTGLAVGCLLALVGAQLPLVGDDMPTTLAYVLTAAVAIAAVVMYVRSRSTAYLATAVAALTLVVPEALLDWTDGSLGPVGVLLVAGATLLGASLVGLRLRHEVAA